MPELRTGHPRASRIALIGLMALAVALVLAGLVLPSPVASAAVRTIDQCNGIAATPQGATTGLDCTVTVVNTISGTTRSSTTTVTRQCSLGPCPSGNGTFTTSSADLVTQVTQCNNSANDAAPPRVTCRVRITNNISEGTPGANPVTAATVNQCVGSGGGGGQFGGTGPLACDPFPATTTGATITQCNGSVTLGGSTAACTVASASKVSPAIPVRVNQCNGTGNAGGTLLTCSASITTNITPAAVVTPTPTPSVTPTATPTATPSTTTPAQVRRVPIGGIETGSGSTAGLRQTWMLTFGGGLILCAGIAGLYRRRLTERR